MDYFPGSLEKGQVRVPGSNVVFINTPQVEGTHCFELLSLGTVTNCLIIEHGAPHDNSSGTPPPQNPTCRQKLSPIASNLSHSFHLCQEQSGGAVTIMVLNHSLEIQLPQILSSDKNTTHQSKPRVGNMGGGSPASSCFNSHQAWLVELLVRNDGSSSPTTSGGPQVPILKMGFWPHLAELAFQIMNVQNIQLYVPNQINEIKLN